MGPSMQVRERPNGAVHRGRQAIVVMSLFGCRVRIGDWIVERPDSDETDEDLIHIRQEEFDRAWEVLGSDPRRGLAC